MSWQCRVRGPVVVLAMQSQSGRPYHNVSRGTLVEKQVLVLDTSGWLSFYGLGSPAKVRVVRGVVDLFMTLGFELGYTSPTLYEVRKSPRPEIRGRRADILGFVRSRGVLVGPSYDRLIDLVSFVQEAYRHDAAIALAAGPHVLLNARRLASNVPPSSGW